VAVDEGFSVTPATAVPTSGLDLAKLASGRVVEARIASLAEGIALVASRHGTLQVDLAQFGDRLPAVGDAVRLQVQPVEGGGKPAITVVEHTPAAGEASAARAAATEDPVLVLARAVRTAAATQTGLAPLYATLAGLAAAPQGSVPEPVRALVAQLMGARLAEGAAPNAEAVRKAFAGSGIFLESRLAAGPGRSAAPAEDLKAALFSLRAALEKWVGGAPAAAAGSTPSGGGAPAGSGSAAATSAGGAAPRSAGPPATAVPSSGEGSARTGLGRLVGTAYGVGAAAPASTSSGGPPGAAVTAAGASATTAAGPASPRPADPAALGGRAAPAVPDDPEGATTSPTFSAARTSPPTASPPSPSLPSPSLPSSSTPAAPATAFGSAPVSGGTTPSSVDLGGSMPRVGEGQPPGTAGGIAPPLGAAGGPVPPGAGTVSVTPAPPVTAGPQIAAPPSPAPPVSSAPTPPATPGPPMAGLPTPGGSTLPNGPPPAPPSPTPSAPSPPAGATVSVPPAATVVAPFVPAPFPPAGGTVPARDPSVGDGPPIPGRPAITVVPAPGPTSTVAGATGASPMAPSISPTVVAAASPPAGPATTGPIAAAATPLAGGTTPRPGAASPSLETARVGDGAIESPLGPSASAPGAPVGAPSTAAAGEDDAVTALLKVVVRGLELAGSLTSTRPGEASEVVAALAGIGPERELKPPPPRRGQAPRGQAAQPIDGVGEDGVEGLAKRALERTEGALSRILLEQFAALDRRPEDPTRPEAGTQRQWTAEMPIATAAGTGVVQMTVERDGGRARPGEASASTGWRVRFSLDVEPLGPIHARIGLSGEKLSIGLWAERPDAAARLGDDVGRLQGALEAAAIPVESIHLATGRPASSTAAATAGRFVDVKL
jgi:hypothetical protein